MTEVPPYHIETSPLICRASQWIGFYMIGPSVMKELIESLHGSGDGIQCIYF